MYAVVYGLRVNTIASFVYVQDPYTHPDAGSESWEHRGDVSVEWGTVDEWVGGVATSGGLLFTGFEISASRRQRRDEEQRRLETEAERREAMAPTVGVTGIPQ